MYVYKAIELGTKEWWYGHEIILVQGKPYLKVYRRELPSSYVPIIRKTLCKATEFYDRPAEGREPRRIFEGDILQLGIIRTGNVWFSEERRCWMVTLDGFRYELKHVMNCFTEITIISNIHDVPIKYKGLKYPGGVNVRT